MSPLPDPHGRNGAKSRLSRLLLILALWAILGAAAWMSVALSRPASPAAGATTIPDHVRAKCMHEWGDDLGLEEACEEQAVAGHRG